MRKTEFHSRSRLTKILALLCCVALLVGSLAIFTDRLAYDTKGNIGKINLNFTDISSSKTGANGIKSENEFALDEVWSGSIVSPGGITNPGDVFDLSYSVKNTGSKSMDVRQRLTLKTTVPMTEGEEPYRISVTTYGKTVSVPGTLSQDGQSITYDFPDYVLNGSYELEDGSLGKEIQFIVRLDFLFEAGNEFMGSGLKVTYGAQAKQHRNTTDEHWASWAEYETKYGEIPDDGPAGPDAPDVPVGPNIPAAAPDVPVTPSADSVVGNAYMMLNDGDPVAAFLFAENGVAYYGEMSTSAFTPCTYELTDHTLVGTLNGQEMSATVSDDWSTITVDANGAQFFRSNEIITFGKDYAYIRNGSSGYIAVALDNTKESYAPVPDSINDLPVYGLLATFAGNTNLTAGPVLPESIQFLQQTFYNCSNMTYVILPASLQGIGEGTFYGCDSLTDVYFTGTEEQWNNLYIDEDGNDPLLNATIHFEYVVPSAPTVAAPDVPVTPSADSVVGNSYTLFDGEGNPVNIFLFAEDGVAYFMDTNAGFAFIPCTYELTDHTLVGTLNGQNVSATVSDDWSTFTVDGQGAVFTRSNELVTFGTEYAYLLDESMVAPIALDNTKASYIPVPASVNGKPVTILLYTFMNNANLTVGPVLPESILTTQATFSGCTNLESVILPASLQGIGAGTFYGCDSLTDVYFAGTEDQWNNLHIGDSNDPLLNATIHFEYAG